MKLFLKLMLLVVVAAVVGPFFITGPDGRPLLSLDRLHVPDVSLPDFGKAADSVKGSLGVVGEEHAKAIAVFKWQDEKGVWHFSDRQEQGRAAQTVTVDPSASVMHLETTKNSQNEEQSGTANSYRDDSPGVPLPATVPLGKLPGLTGDAKSVEQLQKERLDRQAHAMQDY